LKKKHVDLVEMKRLRDRAVWQEKSFEYTLCIVLAHPLTYFWESSEISLAAK
jgi:hypothetical protein